MSAVQTWHGQLTTDLWMSKVGLGWSCGLGTGLVVARREEDDSWSPPSALAAFSAGWGLQVTGTRVLMCCLCEPFTYITSLDSGQLRAERRTTPGRLLRRLGPAGQQRHFALRVPLIGNP